MSRQERVVLQLASRFGAIRTLVERVRALPWPAALQRVTQRGLERLSARIPELAYFLGGRARDAAPFEVRADHTLDELLTRVVASDYHVRAQAAQALANRSEAAAFDALVLALRDRSVEVAVSAATSLSILGGDAARDALLQVLENHEGFYHPLSRAAAVHGLGLLLGRTERAPLHRALRDVNAEVSIAAISALSANPTPETREVLLQVVGNEDGFFLPITRLAAARGLERLPGSCSASELDGVLARENDPLTRTALERLRAQAALHVEA